MKDVCRKTGIVIAVLGIIGAIILAAKFGVKVEIGLLKDKAVRDWGLTIILFITGCASTYILTLIFLALGQILENQETIIYSDDESSESTPSWLGVQSITGSSSGSTNKNGWKCPKCGKINYNYVGTCGCGAVKP